MVISLVKYVPHARAMLDILKQFKDRGLLRETLFQSDGNAILRVVTVDSQQEEWIAKVLGDPVIGNSRVARSRIRYDDL
ncbi:MAG: hypothetical protein Q8L54_08510 [Devosia sp.]|nr:hypothetical protein [Devosia sp.]